MCGIIIFDEFCLAKSARENVFSQNCGRFTQAPCIFVFLCYNYYNIYCVAVTVKFSLYIFIFVHNINLRG